MNGYKRTTVLFLLVVFALSAIAFVARAEDNKISNLRTNAEQGVAEAQFKLGLAYGLGMDVPKDEVEAVKWYRKWRRRVEQCGGGVCLA
jgi:TRAP-type mannitol/chloroaromatic compound transport system permease small subunit